jgi:hypothetical protein
VAVVMAVGSSVDRNEQLRLVQRKARPGTEQ